MCLFAHRMFRRCSADLVALLGRAGDRVIDAPPPLAALSDAVYAHTASHIGGPRALAGTPRIAVIAANEYSEAGAAALAWRDERRIDVFDMYAPLVTAAALSPTWNWRDEGAVLVVAHEHLHHLGGAAPATFTDRGVEEGLAATVAVDVMPRVARALTGRASRLWAAGAGQFTTCVRRVRVASTVATGSRNWRAIPARAWRAAAVRATATERRTMFAAVGMDPADVCPEGVLL